MKHEVGDIVFWENLPNEKFTIEAVSNNMYNWIWSSEFKVPFCGDGSKNFHKPNNHILGKLINISKIRAEKLEELGICD
jgi:hypothetical protein